MTTRNDLQIYTFQDGEEGTGATAKQIARSLNRTYAVIQRFIETNQDLVIRTLQHTLL